MREFDAVKNKEKYEMRYVITEADAMGYGNPDSPISYKKQLETGELRDDVAQYAAELIRSGECMVDITETDDGCIDGRPAISLLYVTESGEFYEKPAYEGEGHERAKVAGGGYMTSLAMLHALGKRDTDPARDITSIGAKLAGEGVVCGAHEDTHAHDSATGCGANDKYRTILQNAGVFAADIAKSTAGLLAVAGVELNSDVQRSIEANWSSVAGDDEYFRNDSGAARFDAIKNNMAAVQGDADKPVAVSKVLDGNHNEDFIVINYVEGKTFSQALFQKKLREQFPDLPDKNLAQAFVVDVPRIIRLAQALTHDSPEDFAQALQAGISYQLATAATLTDGSLRTLLVSETV